MKGPSQYLSQPLGVMSPSGHEQARSGPVIEPTVAIHLTSLRVVDPRNYLQVGDLDGWFTLDLLLNSSDPPVRQIHRFPERPLPLAMGNGTRFRMTRSESTAW